MFKNSWNRKEMIMLFEQLEMYISAGLPIVRSVNIASYVYKKKQKQIILRLAGAIESGQNLSSALNQDIRPPPTILSLISCGETTGTLAEALRSAYILLQKEDELFKRTTSSLVYPIIIGLATLALTVGLMRGIMPQVIPLLLSLKVDLPVLTRVMIVLSDTITSYWIHMLVVGMFGTAVLVNLYRNLQPIKDVFMSTICLVPLIGRIYVYYNVSLFLHSFGSLVVSGVSLNTAYIKTRDAIPVKYIRTRFESRNEMLGSGAKISRLIEGGIPPSVLPLIQAGEMSGQLGVSLTRSANVLDRSIDHSLRRLMSLIEPLMMLVMGGVVGSVALSIMMPIYEISKSLQH